MSHAIHPGDVSICIPFVQKKRRIPIVRVSCAFWCVLLKNTLFFCHKNIARARLQSVVYILDLTAYFVALPLCRVVG